ncbi:MAG: hypothetical protein WC748_10175 [Legionellales bacterium]|jgi:hypothetical protein
MPDQAQSRIIKDDHRYTKRGAVTGAVGGVVIGSTVTQGAVIGGLLGAPFGGAGALPGAAIGAIAALIAGILGGSVSGKIVDKVVRKEVNEIAVDQAQLRQLVNSLLTAHQNSEIERRELLAQIAQLNRRTDEALNSIAACGSSTHNTLRMSITSTPPDGVVCPITNLIFRDPITLKLRNPNGTFCHKTYEREAIIGWKNTCQTSGRDFHDPVTRLPVVNDPQSAPTDEFKEEIVRQFLARHPEHYRDQQERKRNEVAIQLTF